MGGTSTDVCLITGGRGAAVERARRRRAARFACQRSTSTRSERAADRSRWRDAGGAVRVGPASAGADPGAGVLRAGRNAADGHRCESPARPPAGRLAGGVELDRDAAARAFGALDPAACSRVVNAEMLRALRVVSVERGLDPRDFALVAFGGAGPLHACALADELGIGTVLVPEAAGVLSALGLVASDERRDRVESRLVPLAEAGELPRGRRGRPPLSRPVVRADRSGRGRPRARRSTGHTRSGTATPTPNARSSSWPCGRRRSARPGRRAPPASRSASPGPHVLELRGATVLDSPRVGRGSRRVQHARGAKA